MTDDFRGGLQPHGPPSLRAASAGLLGGGLQRLLPAGLALATLGLGALAYRGLRELGEAPAPPTDEADTLLFSPAGGDNAAIVLAVGAWLLWRRRSRLAPRPGEPPAPHLVWGAPALLAALALGAWSHYAAAPTPLLLSLVLLVPGAGGLLAGGRGLRGVLLPAVFLLFALPVPVELLNAIMFPLQRFTAHLADLMLAGIGVAAHLQGDRILTTSGIFQVIESCSGLRLMETLAMSAVVYRELFDRSRGRMVFLLFAGIVLGALVNGARVVSIVLNPLSEIATVHLVQGLVMLVIGVLLLAGVDHVVERLRGWPTPPHPTGGERLRRMPSTAGLALLAGAVGALALATWTLPRWTPGKTELRPLYEFPTSMGDWEVEKGLPLDRQFLGSVRFSEWAHRRYSDGEAQVDLFLGSDDRQSPRVAIRSEKTALPGSGWVMEERGVVELLSSGRRAEWFLVSSRSGRALVYRWHEGLGSRGEELLREVLALDRSPLREPGRGLLVRLRTDVQGPDGGHLARDRAHRRLQEVAARVERVLTESGLRGPRGAPGSAANPHGERGVRTARAVKLHRMPPT